MKNILKRTAVFAACLSLTACGSDYGDMSVRNITEPPAVQQTVERTVEQAETSVPETTVGTVKAVGTEGWYETVATEPGEPEPVTEAYTGVTFPETMPDREQSYIIEELFYKELPEFAEHFEEGISDSRGNDNYSKCNEVYKEFLAEGLLNDPEAFELFGGAFWCDGRMYMRITDWEKTDDVYVPVLGKLNSGCVQNCDYSYYELYKVHETAANSEKVNLHFINVEKNRVEVGGELTEEDIEKIRADIEAAGLDPNAAVFSFSEDCPAANPC